MPLTCLACRTVFPSSELQREHYHTEWHRYNLKRKIVELPPVSQEEFELKKLTAEWNNKTAPGTRGANRTIATNDFDPDKQKLRCLVCQKNFQSTKALNNHLQSKKHIDLAKKNETSRQNSRSDSSRKTSESFDISSQLASQINTSTDCVQLISKSEKQPVEQVKHPLLSQQGDLDQAHANANNEDWESDSDNEDGEWEDMDTDEEEELETEEFIQKISQFNPRQCLFCFEECLFETVEECVLHMERVHSFFVPYAHLVADYGQLISYLHYKVEVMRQCILCSKRSKQFREGGDVRKHMFAKGHNRMAHDTPEMFMEYVHFYNEPDESSPDEYLDDPTGAKLEELLSAALEDEYSLILPSGAVIGHRALARFYKQKPRAPIDMEAQKKIKENSRRYIGFRSNQQQLMQQQGQSNALELSRNLPSMRELKVMQRFKDRQREKLQVKQNILKTHSRDQNFWNMRY